VRTSPIYRNAVLYEAVMRALYGRGYHDRFRALADLIPNGCSVLDVCCGPGTLFRRYLRRKGVRYTGLDINAGFVARVLASGADGLVWDVEEIRPLPRAEYIIMQASLYHFLPHALPLVERLMTAAEKRVLLAEPIRNVASSSVPVLSTLARKLSNPGTGDQPHRFDEARLDALLEPFKRRGQLLHARLIAGGREKLYVLDSENG
jgi:SAM-dependent methyltransferase